MAFDTKNSSQDASPGTVKGDVEFRLNHVKKAEIEFVDSDPEQSPRRKHKKKKKRRRGSRENLTRFEDNHEQPDSADREMGLAFRAMKKQDQEIKPGEKDPRKLALHLALNKKEDSKQKYPHYDFVLTYKPGENNNVLEKLREKFEGFLMEEGFKIERRYTTERTFLILHCSFERLCEEAEHVCLEMPLAGYVVPQKAEDGCMDRFWNHFKSDDDVDFVSAPFCVSKRQIYEGNENCDTFFRPALRSLLVNHILQNVDLRDKESRLLGENTQGLAYMLLEHAYTDAFVPHEKSDVDPVFPLSDTGDSSTFHHGQDIVDPRRALNDLWLLWLKFQPLWKIRNYFGEKIALYFAWLGLLAFSLIVPTLLGLAIFLYGLIGANKDLYEDLKRIQNSPLNESNVTTSTTLQRWAKNAFDNTATPYFALIICLWGTLFLELWKRKNARLAYQWDVDQFEEQEPNRPQFYGTRLRRDPITGEDESIYPFNRRFMKMSGSFSIMVFMVCLVLASLFAVIVYRVIAREDFFKNRGAAGESLASISSTFINTCSIMIMGKVYQKVAVRLTDWENHRTQTSYEDALIIKLFGFQFVNSYTSLFYIAFFRGGTTSEGILGFGSSYDDACGELNDCMTLLSLQVAMLMIMKPIPKLLTDVVIPWLKRMLRRGCCACCCPSSKVEEGGAKQRQIEDYLDYERQKERLGDFTLSEYNEKVLQYGFLMLFAAAFPLAPLIALLTNVFDMKVDGRRLLWINRRPVAHRAEDIGMWYAILEFLNVAGVLTNAFLVAFTSSYGRSWEGDPQFTNETSTVFNTTTNTTHYVHTITEHPATLSRLWLIIGFEHIVFAVKFFISWVIPDTPADVLRAQRREKYQVTNILAKAGMRKGPGKMLAEASSRPTSAVVNSGPQEESAAGQGSSLKPRAHKTGKYQRENTYPPTMEPENHKRSHRLQPLPATYTSKHSGQRRNEVP